MNASVSGYSGTPLARKLGINPGTTVLTKSAPATYADLLAPIPNDVTFATRWSIRVDLIHLFTARKSVLTRELKTLRSRIRPDTAIWVSWPKKSARVPTDITEDTIRSVALPLGFVDIKVCAIDALWSALKLVIRKPLR